VAYESQHLELFAAEAGRVLLGSDALRFGTRDAALSFLGEQARIEPLTIILDEFQWLKHAQPALDSIIQRHWDREALPVTLILAGSALTLMEEMLERGAPLFGRATARPRLEPPHAGSHADPDAFAPCPLITPLRKVQQASIPAPNLSRQFDKVNLRVNINLEVN
jgi:hypothetical protein